MKNRFQKTTLIAGILMISGVASAQKKNETSAAVEFKNNYQAAMMTGDVDKAKKSLIAAKEFIDLAAENAETKDSPKTLWLKGEIYSNFMVLGMQSMDTSFIKLAGDDAMDVSINAFKRGYEVSDKFDGDIRESVYQKHDMLDNFATMMYKGNMFKEAAEVYDMEARFFNAVGEFDTTSVFNGSLCYEKAEQYGKAAEGYAQLARAGYKGTICYVLASSSYRKNNQLAEAKAIIAEGRKKFPLDKELLLEAVNTNIDSGDAAGAESALAEAIAADPKNKQLHYTIGTIYIDLKQNEKAEASLNKALEIDPNYQDALYQLGAHLITWAGEIRAAANQLKFGDPNYDKMVIKSDDIYRRALTPLEKYIAISPNDKDVLIILSQLHRNLGDTNKSNEYKKRADAIK
jgi:tetratricopeptide (TPR) repeat protein/outer membrane murein-binding lipoprotein Lpp